MFLSKYLMPWLTTCFCSVPEISWNVFIHQDMLFGGYLSLQWIMATHIWLKNKLFLIFVVSRTVKTFTKIHYHFSWAHIATNKNENLASQPLFLSVFFIFGSNSDLTLHKHISQSGTACLIYAFSLQSRRSIALCSKPVVIGKVLGYPMTQFSCYLFLEQQIGQDTNQ